MTYRESGAVNAAAISKSGRWLATGCADRCVHLHDLETPIPKDVLEFGSDLNWGAPEISFLSGDIGHLALARLAGGNCRLFVLHRGKVRAFDTDETREVDWPSPRIPT